MTEIKEDELLIVHVNLTEGSFIVVRVIGDTIYHPDEQPSYFRMHHGVIRFGPASYGNCVRYVCERSDRIDE